MLNLPNVAGLRPYSRRWPPAARSRGASYDDQRPAAAAGAALHWLRTQDPERTLHNRQRAAARPVALDQSARTGS